MAWRDVVFTDVIPEGMTFADRVLVDGTSGTAYKYDEDTNILSVELGDVGVGETHTIKFNVTIDEGQYGKTFYNTSVLSSSNADDVKADDETGVNVADGTVRPWIQKTVQATANVGDTVTYTIDFGNYEIAQDSWTDVFELRIPFLRV